MKNLILFKLRNLLPSVLITSAVTTLTLTACQEEDMGFDAETIKKLEYAKQFEKQFGTPDPDHDWSMATLVKASVNLPQITGSAKMNIMTGDPRLSSTRLLAQVMLKDGQAQLDFDAIKGEDKVFVTIEQDGVYQVYHEYPVVNGILTIGTATPITRFAADCPSTVKDIKEGLFTNIDSNVKKYHWNDKYYSLEELRTWATTQATAGTVTTDNYDTTTPFNADCISGGAYNFAGATLASSVISVPAEGGYVYNGTFYTLTQLRQYAQDMADAGEINVNNYGAVPFNTDCVIPQGADWSNPEIDRTKVNAIVDKDGYWCKLNNNFAVYTLEEIIEEKKKVNQNIGYSLDPLLWSSMVPAGTNKWDVTESMIDWSKAQVDLTQAGYYAVSPGDIIWWPQGNATYQKNTEAEIIDIVKARGTSDYTPLLESSIVKPAHLDFTSATVNTSDANITLVAPGNSFIYNGTVFESETTLQNYTEANKLGNKGPYTNCFSGDDLDFSAATIDETKAPLEFTKLSIDLTYFKDVETQAATPWTHGYGYSLYGPKAFFQEQEYYFGVNHTENKYENLYGSTTEEKLKMLASIEEGFKIKTKGGAIDLPFIYGSTQIIDQFGYVFYEDGEDPLSKPHYVLMEDGRPDVNVYLNSWGEGAATGFSGTGISTWVEGLKAQIDGKDTPMSCYCSPGSGIWKEPFGTGTSQSPKDGVHESWCTTNYGGECNCDPDREGDGIYGSAGKHKPDCRDHFKAYTDAYNEQVYGTTYRMIYQKPDGTLTYDIPANLNVVFFICPVGSVADLTANPRTGYQTGNFNYSDPTLNKRIGHLYGNSGSPSYNNDASPLKQTSESGAVKACHWFDGTHHYLGFEDGGNDEDLNDIIFWVDGAFDVVTTHEEVKVHPIKWHLNYTGKHMTDDTDLFYIDSNKKEGDTYTQPDSNPQWLGHTFLGWAESPRGPIISGSDEPGHITGSTPDGGKCYFAIWDPMPSDEDPEPISWIFACEDLGGTFDYDFNDVVWEVKKVFDGEGTCTGAQVSVLAAGGTLPFTLKYNSNAICTKTEAFDDIENTDVVNADAPNGKTKTPKTFTVTGIGADWNVSENYTKFSVDVEGASGTTHIAAYSKTTEPGKTPQVILLPGEWEWPTESTPINTAYTKFNNWVTEGKAASWTEWSSHKQDGKTVSRTANGSN